MPIGASDQTSVVNGALAELGSTQRVSSINDGSNLANRARALWNAAAELMLVLHPWNPAIGRALLNRASIAPAFGWPYAYQLPADCLRWLPPSPADDPYYEHFYEGEREGDYILTSWDGDGGLPCRYIRRELDPRKWSPGMVSVMEIQLAMAMCEGVTQSKSIHDDLRVRLEGQYGDGGLLARAKRADGLETGRRRRSAAPVRSDWLAARVGRGRRW